MGGLPVLEYLASAEWVAGKLKECDIKPAGEWKLLSVVQLSYTDVNDIGSLTLNLPQTDGSVIKKITIFPWYYPGMNSGNGE